MDAKLISNITQNLPLPGRVWRKVLEHLSKIMVYPELPISIRIKKYDIEVIIYDLFEYIQRNIYFLGYHEYRETKLISSLLKKGSIFFDVGANMGWYTLIASKIINEKGKIYSFEPSKIIYERLVKNIMLNNCKNVVAEKVAVSNSKGSVMFKCGTKENAGTGSIIIDSSENVKDDYEIVNTIDLDSYIKNNNIDRIDLMKIDVEGAELNVLLGAQNALKNGIIKKIIVEINDDKLQMSDESSTTVYNLLKINNYTIYHIKNNGVKKILENEKIRFDNVLAIKDKI